MIHRIIFLILASSSFQSQCLTSASAASPEYFIATTTGPGYVATGIDLKGKLSVVFEVQSQSDARVALVSVLGQYQEQMYEIVFDTTLRIALRRASDGTNAATCFPKTDAGLLQNGAVPVSLWISWANGSLTIGKGNETGKHFIMFYPDNSAIANLSTMAVSSWNTMSASWKIAYNQTSGNIYKSPVQDNGHNDPIRDCSFCKDVVFAADPDILQMIDLQIILVGRTSFMFRVNDYKSLNSILLHSQDDEYEIILTPPTAHIYKNGIRRAYYVIVNSNPPLNEAPGYYWISWMDGLIAFGFGEDIGQKTLMIFNEFNTVEMHSATATVNGTIFIPFRFYINPRALRRSAEEIPINGLRFQKKASDSCSTGAIIRNVTNPRCRPTECSSFCRETPECTAFCLHGSSSTASPCTCELQAKPGTPSSSYLYRYEQGATYWEIMP